MRVVAARPSDRDRAELAPGPIVLYERRPFWQTEIHRLTPRAAEGCSQKKDSRMRCLFALGMLTLAVVSGCADTSATTPALPVAGSVTTSAAPATPAAPPTVVLEVPTMSCSHCAAHIGKTLKTLPGIGEVASDVEKKQMTITVSDPAQFNVDKAIKLLAEKEYPDVKVVAGAK